MYRSRPLFVTAALSAAIVLAVPHTASANAAPPDPIVSGLVGPLQIDVGHRGQVYVGQSFTGDLTKVRVNGTTKDLTNDFAEGVASRRYTVAYTSFNPEAAEPVALLKVRRPNGKIRTVADIQAFEEDKNPDASNTYGFLDLPDECAEQLPPDLAEPYTGIIESHPYALANAPGGGWYVADAAANAILRVSRHGHVGVVAVLPPQPTVVPEGGAGLPECTVGETFAFEPVPTDVEVKKNGKLIVSLLPGGPEDPSLGARGSVIRVNPKSGAVKTLGTGFAGATNVAVGPGGKIYVAELFANRISVLKNGVSTPFADVPSPAGVEFARGKVYASIDVFANGSIVKISPKSHGY